MTYKQAYDKIIEAYFRDEIRVMSAKFCFCGTLAPASDWRHSHNYPYSAKEYERMEDALFDTIGKKDVRFFVTYKHTEDALFAGMSAALDVLKQIHIERGEIIDEAPAFTKRILQSTTTN